jgi:hypothetical protein
MRCAVHGVLRGGARSDTLFPLSAYLVLVDPGLGPPGPNVHGGGHLGVLRVLSRLLALSFPMRHPNQKDETGAAMGIAEHQVAEYSAQSMFRSPSDAWQQCGEGK